jgi:hypothetical protein
MQKTLLVTMLALSGTLSLRAATVPIFEERFNDAGSLEYSNGAEQGPGLTDKPGDKAYKAHAETPDPTQPQPGATLEDTSQLTGDLSQFTLTLWYKADREIQDPDSLAHLGGFYLLWDKVRGLTLRLNLPPGGADFSNWFNAGIKGPVLSSNSVDEWIFYAITWNYDTRSCVIYQGTAAVPCAVFGEKHNFDVTGPVKGSTSHAIGNHLAPRSNSLGSRPFSGQIDNIRVYDTALDQNAIEAIRTADLANTSPKLP